MSKLKFAVILAGAGKWDGSEIQESVLLLAAIDSHGGQYQCFAPDMEQHDVIDHLTGHEMHERRSVLREAARIARGEVKPLSAFRAEEFDALVLPGGYGAAKNLSTYAMAGEKCIVNAEVEKAIKEIHAAGKPIGALCISPVIVAKTLQDVKVTLGSKECDAAKDIEKWGAKAEDCEKDKFCYDVRNKVYSTPCYMLDSSIHQIHKGIDAMIEAMVEDLNKK